MTMLQDPVIERVISPAVAERNRAVEREVRAALEQSGYAAIRNITFELDDGELTLRGQVPSYYMKQMAVSTVAKVAGVALIYNRLKVV